MHTRYHTHTRCIFMQLSHCSVWHEGAVARSAPLAKLTVPLGHGTADLSVRPSGTSYRAALRNHAADQHGRGDHRAVVLHALHLPVEILGRHVAGRAAAAYRLGTLPTQGLRSPASNPPEIANHTSGTQKTRARIGVISPTKGPQEARSARHRIVAGPVSSLDTHKVFVAPSPADLHHRRVGTRAQAFHLHEVEHTIRGIT